jgi:pimeloyl-ACP methyl ester carboxylesterase
VAQTNATSFYSDSINYYRLEHDVVLIDVRGTGHSNPLHCKQLQLKKDLKQQFTEMYPADAVKDCYDSLSKIADLTQYTTTNMAIDMEEIRKWLGYDKINLFGLSYGGRLAQVYMKMFPQSVASCVLWSPTTTYSKLPLYHAQYAEESISKIFNDCKNDSLCNLAFPNFKEEFKDLMRRGKNKAFEYKFKRVTGGTQDIVIPWFSFQTKIRSLMYTPLGIRQIPFIVHQSYLGNWQTFLSLFPDKSSYDDLIAEGLYLCVTCSEDVPYISKTEEDSLTRDTFAGDYRVEQQRNACNKWVRGTIPENFFEPVTSTIPTLLFSGYFDPVTAPSMAKKIVQTLPNSFLITIPTMSHMLDGLSNLECFDKMAVDFFNNPEVRPNIDCINRMLPMAYKTNEKQ